MRVRSGEVKSSEVFLLPTERTAAEIEGLTVAIPDLEKLELMLGQLS
jgi:hypothetical protein